MSPRHPNQPRRPSTNKAAGLRQAQGEWEFIHCVMSPTPSCSKLTLMSMIIFSHANSFPASTYGVLFKSLRARGFTVKAIEKFGHDSQYPVTNNWPHLVQQLVDFTQTEVETAGKSAFLVGHSLGGLLSLMAAARAPQLVRGVLLVDSPILGGWRATTLGAVSYTH